MDEDRTDPFLDFLYDQLSVAMQDLQEICEDLREYDVEDDAEFAQYVQTLMYRNELEHRIKRLMKTKEMWKEHLYGKEKETPNNS